MTMLDSRHHNSGHSDDQTNAARPFFGCGAINATYTYPGASAPALDTISFSVEPGRITGLLGPNGSGKTTLMKLLAGWGAPQSGEIGIVADAPATVFEGGAAPSTSSHNEPTGRCLFSTFNSPKAMPRVFYAEPNLFSSSIKRCAKEQEYHPYFDADRLFDLCKQLDIDTSKPLRTMSTGQRALATAALSLAHRAPVLLMDELHNGLDVPNRYKLYETMMEDYADFPRTIIVATHLVSELEGLIEDALVLMEGRVLFHDSADALRALAAPLPAGESSALQYGFLHLIEGKNHE